MLGLTVLGALYLIDRALGREKRPRGALIASFFALYFSGRFVIEFFKEFEGMFVTKDSPLRMGQILSLPGMLLGFYGLYYSFKHKLPAEWPSDDDTQDESDDEEPDEEEDEEDDADDDDKDDADTRDSDKPRADAEVDPDVAGEFDAEGRLKRQRES
jgi:hypothetical protein